MRRHSTFAAIFHVLAGMVALAVTGTAYPHPESLPSSAHELGMVNASRVVADHEHVNHGECVLHLSLQDADSHASVAGLVRVTPVGEGREALVLEGLFERPAGWFSMKAGADVSVPPGRYRVEATRGIETEIASQVVECLAGGELALTFAPKRFFEPESRNLHSANTHLHLLLKAHSKMGIDLHDRQDADEYLKTVGASDGLDLVYVSYLTAPDMEYVSNEYTDADFERFSHGPTLFANGVEHRHGSKRIHVEPVPGPPGPDGKPTYTSDDSRAAFTFGHVMLLDLAKRSMLASIGPGLADDPDSTDGVPLRTAMIDAAGQGGGVIWCHGSYGLERIPDWVAGMLHAQNIYDGGNEGTFDTVYYPCLNIGLKVPFSTGTDWGFWDFSRVYVEAEGEFTSKVFLSELLAGRTTITNGPFLEFEADGLKPGGTLELEKPGTVRVRGRAVGRSDFIRLQVVLNGRVVYEKASRPVDGHFEADFDLPLEVGQSGWLALRVPPNREYSVRSNDTGSGTNIFGKEIFAHTSPVYITVARQPAFDREAIPVLIADIEDALATIDEYGTFANDAERDALRRIYTDAEAKLRTLLASGGRR